jgi:hypothetical protein
MRWRLIRRCLLFGLLGLATSVAVAWGVSVRHRVAPNEPTRREMGVAVVGGAIVRLTVNRWPGRLHEQWQLQDTVNEGWYREGYRISAQHIVEIGGAAYDEYEFEMLSRLSVELGFGAPPAPPPVARIDDRAARSAPVPIGNIARMRTTLWRAKAGWPLPALQCGGRSDMDAPDPAFARDTSEHGAVELPWPWDGKRKSGGAVSPVLLPIEPRPGLVLNTIFYALLWFLLLLIPRAAPRAHRRARGRCPRCGYSLRGQPDPGCPECGHGREAPPPAPAAA